MGVSGSNNSVNKSGRANTLGLEGAELDRVLDAMEQPSIEGTSKRAFVRWPFRKQTILIKLSQFSGSEVTLRVACRNVSRGGMAVLHNAYVHPGSRCAVAMPHPEHGFVRLIGSVMRCTHCLAQVHELGIRFDDPIDPSEYLATDPFKDYYSLEHVNPEDLTGTVLHLDDSELDRRIVQHYLRDSNLRIRPASTVDEAIEIANEGVDLALSDYYLENEVGADFIARLNEMPDRPPVILVTSDMSAVTRERVADVRADGFLGKPFSQDLLLRAIGEFMIVRKNEYAVINKKEVGGPDRDLVKSFVKDLHKFAARLEAAMSEENAEVCLTLCSQISGTAPTLNFEGIGKLALIASRRLVSCGGPSEVNEEIRALIVACSEAKVD